jgi:large subunit ribosomal protein L40
MRAGLLLAGQRAAPALWTPSVPARALSSSAPRQARKAAEGTDPKKEQLRRALYPGNVRTGAAPTGTWRPDVGRALQRAIPSVQAHETVERAWLLHQRHRRWARERERARKFACMKDAMDTLAALDQELYRAANRAEDPRTRTPLEADLSHKLAGSERRAMEGRIRGLFPRDLRPPADTPPKDGWKYEFSPVKTSTPSSCSCCLLSLTGCRLPCTPQNHRCQSRQLVHLVMHLCLEQRTDDVASESLK